MSLPACGAEKQGPNPGRPRRDVRRLRQETRRELGAAPAVIYVDDCHEVFPVEELLTVLGVTAQEGLLPYPRDETHGPNLPL